MENSFAPPRAVASFTIIFHTRGWGAPLSPRTSSWNGTGFPRVFYLKYHLYAKYFPLWALGVYRGTTA